MDKFTLLSISSMIFRVATFPFFFIFINGRRKLRASLQIMKTLNTR